MRLGDVPDAVKRLDGRPRIWIHASSVGEVGVAEALIDALESLEDYSIVVSTFTWDGYRQAALRLKDRVPVMLFPLDLKWCVDRALRSVRPDAFVAVESEFWPNFLWAAHKAGVATLLANGRISSRSFRRFNRLRPFVKRVLGAFDVLSMAGPRQAERALALGAEPDRVVVSPNAKFGLLVRKVERERGRLPELRRLLGLSEETVVFVAGSVRGGEEEAVVRTCDAVSRIYPGAVSFIAPRHMNRVGMIGEALHRRGTSFQRWSEVKRGVEPRTAPVIIVDTLGDLFALYGLSTVSFCGASLVRKGGQNVMEPAAWGIPPVYGPHMEDFLDAAEMLEKNDASVRLKSGDELPECVLQLLGNPSERGEKGRRAEAAARSHEGAALATARILQSMVRRGTEKRDLHRGRRNALVASGEKGTE